jgi:alcohol-forming fatty acyl-CoA reductase
MNIIGVKKMIDLCREIKNLDVFAHISTAYANCDLPHITEAIYDTPVNPDKIIEAIDWLDDDICNEITPKVIKDKPNTYTYTKQIAESLVYRDCKDTMPCTIIRPSIVGCSWREPFAGWIENFNGPSALFPATGTGVLRSMLGNNEAICDIVTNFVDKLLKF